MSVPGSGNSSIPEHMAINLDGALDLAGLQQGLELQLTNTFGEPVVVAGLRLAGNAWPWQLWRCQALADSNQPRQLVAAVATAPLALPASLEAAAMDIARANGVAVPALVAVDDGSGALGRPLLVARRVPGVAGAARVLEMVRERDSGEQLARQLGWAFGALHRIPLADLPVGLDTRMAATSLAAARNGCAGLLQSSPALALGLRWLDDQLPVTEVAPCLVHGDLRSGNLVVADDGLRAVLGWQHCHLGDPMADLAWACLRCWRGGFDDAEVSGIWSRGALVEGYQDASGDFDLERFHWWKVLGTLQRGLHLAELTRRHLEGQPGSLVQATAGRRLAEQEYDLLNLIA